MSVIYKMKKIAHSVILIHVIIFASLFSNFIFAEQTPWVKVQEIRKGGDPYIWLLVSDNGCGQGYPYVYWLAGHTDDKYRISLAITSLVSGKQVLAVGTCTSGGYLTAITDFRLSQNQ